MLDSLLLEIQPVPLPACPAAAYHFRLLYKGVTMYPIMGALRHSYGGPWEVGAWECNLCGRQGLGAACVHWRGSGGWHACPLMQLLSAPSAGQGALPSRHCGPPLDSCTRACLPACQGPPTHFPTPPCLQVFRRVQLAPGEEEYRLIGSFEQEPKPPAITDAFRAAWAAQQA